MRNHLFQNSTSLHTLLYIPTWHDISSGQIIACIIFLSNAHTHAWTAIFFLIICLIYVFLIFSTYLFNLNFNNVMGNMYKTILDTIALDIKNYICSQIILLMSKICTI